MKLRDCLILLPVLMTLVWVTGCGSSDDSADQSAENSTPDEAPESGELRNPRDLKPDPQAVARLRVYTGAPGFQVLIDGSPALTADDKPVTTPCEVTVLRGNHEVRIAQGGYHDQSRQVAATGDLDVIFEPRVADSAPVGGVLQSAYFDAPLHQPIPLTSVNSDRPELDPYVTADGLSLWFVGDRAEGRGVYYATRPSPFHEFDPPQLVLLTRSYDLPASPSVTADGLGLVYAVPSKSRVRMISRSGPLTSFEESEWLRYSNQQKVTWPSAQILPDGLRLYWTELAGDKLTSRASIRKSRDQKFNNSLDFPLPGDHPCLSSDGLRQYSFDGKILRRARRAKITQNFGTPEVLANIDLPGYVPDPHRRQFFISDDEQWLFYSDDPATSGDLHMVRLFAGPGWGFIARGRSIPPRPVVVADTGMNKQDPGDQPFDPRANIDPRTLPLPYTQHRTALTELIEKEKYADAAKLIETHQQDPQFAEDRELLAWDQQDVARLQQFWKQVRQAVQAKKPGDEIRIGSAKVALEKFENDVIHARGRTTTVEKPLRELGIVDLSALFDEGAGEDNPDAQLTIGTFMFYDPRGNPRTARTRLDEAGPAGREFLERLSQRLLQQARQEFARENIAAGREFLAQLQKEFPESSPVATAQQMERDLYKMTKWTPRGMRQWDMTGGMYAADNTHQADSLLLSPRIYQNFELSLEWKVEGRTGQGGVYFRYPGGGKPIDNAFKIHLANDAGVPPDLYCTGSLFKSEAPAKNAAKGNGQWQTLRMEVRGQNVQVWINGQHVLDTVAIDPQIPLKGHVALDGAVGGITYRKTLLIELPGDVKEPVLAPETSE